jgi:hypothetical protein
VRAHLKPTAEGGLTAAVLREAIAIVSGYSTGRVFQHMDMPSLDVLIDTGAARSCIPTRFCSDANGNRLLRPVDYRKAFDWRGNPSSERLPVYLVRVRFLGSGPFTLRAYETNQDAFIAGRDLLVHFLAAFDGPARLFGVRRTNTVDRWLRSFLAAP